MESGEAWAHFWANFIEPVWKSLPESERNPLRKANDTAAGKVVRKTATGKAQTVRLGIDRMRNFFEMYAPGCYTIKEVIVYNWK